MKYGVVVGDDLDVFLKDVNKQLNEDWYPLGGIQVVNYRDELLFYQAMGWRGRYPTNIQLSGEAADTSKPSEDFRTMKALSGT